MHDAGGFQFRVSHLSFFQTNRFLVEDLLQTMTAGAKGDVALDLYSGVGFFTLPLGKTFNKVISVDANLAATTDLYANAEAAGMAVTSHNEHAEEFLRKTQEKPDFVSLDPPRAGLGAGAAAALLALGSPEIRYLSCDPSTLARDFAILYRFGKEQSPENADAPINRYEIVQVHLFDLFPQTFPHRNARTPETRSVKAPAVAIAAAFVCGIMLGLCPPFAQFSSSPVKLGLCLAASAALGLIALLLLRSEKLLASGAASLLCWLSLGLTGAAIAQEPLPSNHVTELLEHNQLSLKTPLRWHGILRDEPTHLPWGTGYEIELLGVDYEGTSMPISGGLRISFTPHAATMPRSCRNSTLATKSTSSPKPDARPSSATKAPSTAAPIS